MSKYGTGAYYVFKIFPAQTIINASPGSGGNNEVIGTGSLILKFVKIGTYGCRRVYRGWQYSLLVDSHK